MQTSALLHFHVAAFLVLAVVLGVRSGRCVTQPQVGLAPGALGSWCTCGSVVRWQLTLYTARMVAGSKAEEELLSMTRGEVETELLKVPAHQGLLLVWHVSCLRSGGPSHCARSGNAAALPINWPLPLSWPA
jgi:hypothetical protein